MLSYVGSGTDLSATFLTEAYQTGKLSPRPVAYTALESSLNRDTAEQDDFRVGAEELSVTEAGDI